MLRLRIDKRWLWLLLVLIVLPALWVLQIEFTYQRNVRHGIPADYHIRPQRTVVMWKA